MSASVKSLVTAVVDGEVHQFAEIVRRFDDRVRQVIKLKVRDPASCEDLVQETFYRAFTQLDQLQDVSRFESWLVIIARNCVNDHHRRKKVRAAVESSMSAKVEIDRVPASEETTWVWQEVEKLPQQFADVLQLRYLKSMSYDEIADQLHLNVSTVRGRIFEARKALRQRLTERGLFP